MFELISLSPAIAGALPKGEPSIRVRSFLRVCFTDAFVIQSRTVDKTTPTDRKICRGFIILMESAFLFDIKHFYGFYRQALFVLPNLAQRVEFSVCRAEPYPLAYGKACAYFLLIYLAAAS